MIVDCGSGIEPEHLARATLERGFSTAISLGLGFKMMWELADRIAISTGSSGTIVLVSISERPRLAPEAALMARFPTLEI